MKRNSRIQTILFRIILCGVGFPIGYMFSDIFISRDLKDKTYIFLLIILVIGYIAAILREVLNDVEASKNKKK